MVANTVVLTLHPRLRWLNLARLATREFCERSEFTPALVGMVESGVGDACEALIRTCVQQGFEEAFELHFSSDDDSLVVQVVFSEKVSFAPLERYSREMPPEEPPSGGRDEEAPWLMLVKEKMDRVTFERDGDRCILKMVKYRRKEGQETQLWVLGLAPRLGANVRLDTRKGSVDDPLPESAILEDIESGRVLRLDPGGAFVVQHLDGRHTVREIYMEYVDKVGLISPQKLALIFETLEGAGMLAHEQRTAPPGRFRKVVQKLVNPSITIPHADSVVNHVYRFTRVFVGPFGFLALFLIGLSGLIPVLSQVEYFRNAFHNLGPAHVKDPWILAPVYILLFVSIVAHEFGHALVCKHYGGRIHRMGIMFYLAMFIFYCDTSSAWNFPKKAQRILVSLGGPMVTFALTGVFLWLAGNYAGSDSVWGTIWVTLAFLSLISLVMNFNPLIRMDSYYMLSDWLGVPNLRPRSLAYWQGLAMACLGRRGTQAQPAPREKRILLIYGFLGGLATVIFFAGPFLYYSHLLLTKHGHHGRIAYAWVIVLLVLARLSHAAFIKWRSLRYYEVPVP